MSTHRPKITTNAVRSIKRSSKKKKIISLRGRIILLFVGIVFICAGTYRVPEKKDPHPVQNIALSEEVESFSAEPVSVDASLYRNRSQFNFSRQTPVRIIIPEVAIDLAVQESPVQNGFWKVYQDTAGFGLGSAYPDEKGNTVIFAHARDKLFRPLLDAKKGMKIFVLTKDKWFEYEVSNIKEVTPETKEVIAPTKESIITLYTCSGFADSKRLIVQGTKLL